MTSSPRGGSPASRTARCGRRVKSISPPGWPLALPYRSYDQTGMSVLQVRKLQRRCTTRRRSIPIGCGATLAILGTGRRVILAEFLYRRSMSALGHVWTAPGCQGIDHVAALASEQPCVRPMSAAHRAAGHNALRGSGPDQKLAFIDALAQVGCPNHRIDRFCITCCLPFPTITPRLLTRSRSLVASPTAPARAVPCSARLWSSSPKPCARSCWPARSPLLSSVAVEAAS